MTVTIYHNPACGTSRKVLEMLRDSGVETRVVEYLRTPPDRATLERLFARLGRAMLRRKGTPYEELGLDDPGLDPARLIDALEAHPILMERPIVVAGEDIRLCRPAETARDILPA